jgi:hypothetical protein
LKPTQNPSIADVTDVTPAVILRGAALYLQLHGWHQGCLYSDDNPTNPTPAACAQGGMGMAAFGQSIPTDAANSHRAEWRDFKRASDFFNDYLNLTGAKQAPTEDQEEWEGPSVGDWNDDPDRTPAQVHTALLAAADEWDRLQAPLPVLNLPGGENA